MEMKQPYFMTGRWKKAASLFLDESSFLENCRGVGAREVLFKKELSYGELIKRGFPFLPLPTVSLKKGLLRAVPLRHSRLAKPWTIHLCLKGLLRRAVSQEMADAFFFQALKG